MILLVAPEIPANSDRQRRELISSSIFATVIVIMTELMFFAALISAYMIIRSGSTEWPPWDQPRLPVLVTALNSLVLLASAVTLYRSVQAVEENAQRSKQFLILTLILGSLFVGIQGYEWLKLIGFGLTMTSSNYGAVFYLIIGAHGIHVLGGLLVLLKCFVNINSPTRPLAKNDFQAAQLFWLFVVGVWPVLYVLVYLM